MSLSKQRNVEWEGSTGESSVVSDEFTLILEFVRCEGYPTTRLQALDAAEINWARLVEVARKHRVIPWVARYVGRFPDGVPDGIREDLHRLSKQIALRSLFLTGELLRILDLMAAAGIRGVPFKGPALGAICYGDLSLRDCDDIDVLVPSEEVMRATDLLKTQGYDFWKPTSKSKQTRLLRTGWAFTFVHRRTQIHLDLHWRFTSSGFSFPFCVEALWRRLDSFQLAGRKVPSFPPEDILLLHCVHGAKHQWERLEWIYALSRLVRSIPHCNWEELLRQAQQLRAERMLLLGLKLASDLFGTVLPTPILQKLDQDRTIPYLVSQARIRLVSQEDASVQEAEQCAFRFRVRECWRDRIRYFIYLIGLKTAPTAKDHDAIPLPAVFSGLYYVARPFRLVHTYGLNPLKKFFGLLRSV